jgi:transcriptional regulator with XRE-family HTH domain
LPYCRLTLRFTPQGCEIPRPAKSGLGEHIRARRKQLGLFQEDLATRFGVDEATVRRWEREQKGIGPEHLPAVFDFLGCDPRQVGETLAERLRAKRRSLGLTQEALAAKLGLSHCSVWRVEAGRPLGRRIRAAFEAFTKLQSCSRSLP